jgi:hypothetical protein
VAALEDGRRGLAAAREAGDTQLVAPLLAWNARLADSAAAEPLFDEFMKLWVDSGSVSGASTAFPDAAAAAVRLGRAEQFVATAKALGGELWLRAAVAYAEGELVHAAEILSGIGTLPEEARTRLEAAAQLVSAGRRAEAEPELQQALAAWRSVGAAAYVREGEALLAASA